MKIFSTGPNSFLNSLTLFIFSDHGHKKFGRLWEQIVFPYENLKTDYAHWHITPIQIVAELRDPNKLKKPKRPDLIQQNMALLPYRYLTNYSRTW
jgi:hypothetical protein